MIHVYEIILGFFDYDSTIIQRDFFETDASFPRVPVSAQRPEMASIEATRSAVS